MKHFIFILLLFIFLSPGVKGQNNFFTFYKKYAPNIFLEVALTTTAIKSTSSGSSGQLSPPYNCDNGMTYKIKYDYSVAFYDSNGIALITPPVINDLRGTFKRSEERRVGKECRSGWTGYRYEYNKM